MTALRASGTLQDVAIPALFVALWSTGFIGARLGLPHAGPLTFLALRYALAAGLLALVALSTRALGAMPVFGFSVLPAMIALALTSRIGLVFGLAATIGALGAAGGYALAFVLELPVGATQTALLAVVLVVVISGKRLRGS